MTVTDPAPRRRADGERTRHAILQAATGLATTEGLEGLSIGRFGRLVREAQEAGDLDPAEEPAQLAFEIEAFLLMANNAFVLEGDPLALERARRALRRRVQR